MKVGIARSDSESVFTGAETHFQKFVNSVGIWHELSAPYRHEQNGIVENCIKQLLIAMLIQLRFGGDVPWSYWLYSLIHAAIAQANVPSAALHGWSPQEFWEGRKLKPLKMLFMGVIFCLCYAKIYVRGKFDPRAFPCMYLGLSEFHRAFRVQSLSTGKVYFSRDVHFVKDQFPCRRGSVPKAIMNNLESVELEDDDENQAWTMPPDHMGKTEFDSVLMKKEDSPAEPEPVVPASVDEVEEKGEHDIDEFDVDFPSVSRVVPVMEEKQVRRSGRNLGLSAKALENIINEQEGGSAMIVSHHFGPDPAVLAEAKKNQAEYIAHLIASAKEGIPNDQRSEKLCCGQERASSKRSENLEAS